MVGSSFADLCRQGKAQLEEIDDFVDQWHDSDDARPLAEFLGLSEKDYALWIKNPEELKTIAERIATSLQESP